ncbi:MAG: V-type ATP synthase subunit F [Oscillospiraceae bacterium]|jgi:V/A-type H+-transporting ATPase subunit F|nr:V-type ATP synthase subunit F [Oscillospiraceae bacterium]
MKKAAVIGDLESIYGFENLGFEIFAISDFNEAINTIKRLVLSDSYAIIYITEFLASAISDELKAYEEKIYPAIIPILGINNNTGIGTANMQRFVEKAVGSNIL